MVKLLKKKNALVLGILFMACFWACGDDSGSLPDGSIINNDVGVADIANLYSCETPGQACNAHDTCAINPICGNDFLCRPSSYQNCDDGLECTLDICEGNGLCKNEPKDDWCSAPVTESSVSVIKCFQAEDRNPDDSCKKCDPEKKKDGWSLATGGNCDDENDCTKDDYCQDGSCKGTYYGSQCNDELACTDDLCDGVGGCRGNPIKTNTCLINEKCYASGDKDTSGCNTCDPSKSQSSWTSLVLHCLINSVCYKPGDKDSSGCGECDPTQNPTGWTQLAGLCKINGVCYKPGDKNTGQCAECDPTVSTYEWTVKGNYCLINGTCYDPGDLNATGCGQCAPSSSKTQFTAVANKCLINGLCYSPGALSPFGTCAQCDPSANNAGWTVTGNACLIDDVCYTDQETDSSGCYICASSTSKTTFTPVTNKCHVGLMCYNNQETEGSPNCLMCNYSAQPNGWSAAATGTTVDNYTFESGTMPGSWTASAPTVSGTISVGWKVANIHAVGSTTYSLYYGDSTNKNYDTPGASNSGSVELPAIAFTASKKSGIRFWLYMDVESDKDFDLLQITANGTQVWKKNVTTTVTPKTWQEMFIDLTSYAGQSVTIKFFFDTTDAVSNTGEGVFIDDITIYHDC